MERKTRNHGAREARGKEQFKIKAMIISAPCCLEANLHRYAKERWHLGTRWPWVILARAALSRVVDMEGSVRLKNHK